MKYVLLSLMIAFSFSCAHKKSCNKTEKMTQVTCAKEANCNKKDCSPKNCDLKKSEKKCCSKKRAQKEDTNNS